MAKALLNDDSLPSGVTVDEWPYSTRALLDDETDVVDLFQEQVDQEALPTVSVDLRTMVGYSDDGNPEYVWVPLVEDVLAVLWEERTQRDEQTGRVNVVATLTVVYDSDEDGLADENVRVTSSSGGTFRATAVRQVEDRLELDLVREDGGD